VAFPPRPLESPDCSCRTPSVLIIQYNSSTCYAGLLLQRWLPWACTAGTSCLCLPFCLTGRARLCWSRSAFSTPDHALFPAPFLWLYFGYLISGYSPWRLQSPGSPSAEGLSSAMISQADYLSQLATETFLLGPAVQCCSCAELCHQCPCSGRPTGLPDCTAVTGTLPRYCPH